MKHFFLGFVIGAAVGGAGAVLAASITGKDGYLVGWEVLAAGEVVCANPYVTVALRDIHCE